MVSQFLRIDFDFIRSREFREMRPSTLKVYFYIKSRVLRGDEIPLYRGGKLACRLSRRKIVEETGLSRYQVNQTVAELKAHEIKVIRTGRASYFILGEWRRIRIPCDEHSSQYVENFYLEKQLYPQICRKPNIR